MSTRKSLALTAAALAAALTLSACASSTDPLTEPADGAAEDGATIVVGSQDYYSNEIVAEIYAQALEADGHTVDRQFRIGQREVYLPEIEAGAIDLFPEYTGPLLQYWQPDTSARLADDVYTQLQQATPDGLRVLDQSPATDQDAYAVTEQFAQQWGVTTIADLAEVPVPLTLGGNSEGETRPNGPRGLRSAYGVDVTFTPIEDSAGPLTIKALRDGTVQLAIIYTADPAVPENDLVVLEDPAGLFLASHVVPVASDRVNDQAAEVINRVSAELTPEALVALNARSVGEQLPAATIAKEWLAEADLP